MKSHRPERVASVVRQVVSDAIANKLSDPRIEPLSSVTRVEVSKDLEHAKVWVSVMGNETTGRRTIQGLKSAAGHVQRMVAKELQIRVVPMLSFHLDQSIKRGIETLRLINEAMKEYEGESDTSPEQEGEAHKDTKASGDGS